jgi:uncharacterized protein YggE
MKTYRKPMAKRFVAAILASAVLTTGIALVPMMTAPAIAQEAAMRTLTVTGQGQEFVATTKAQVNLGVTVEGQDAETVQRQVAERSAAVVELLQSRNVEKLETTGIRLSPRYRYDDGESTVVGFTGTNTVSFRVPNEDAGELIDDAVNAGANQIQNISFIAEDAALDAARQNALRQATADAQTQANTVLSALNLGAEEIVNIQIDGANRPMPVPLPRGAALASADSEVSTPVVGGEQTVQASVTLTIRY